MRNFRPSFSSWFLAALGAILVTGWALAQQGLLVELGSLHLLPPQTSIQGPGVQLTRSLVLSGGENAVPLLFTLSESSDGCPSLGQPLPWLEVFSDAETERFPDRILGSIQPGETPALHLVFDSSGLQPGDSFSGRLCLDYSQDFSGFDPPPPQVPLFDELQVSLQIVQPVEDVPALSAWSLLLTGVLLLGWGLSRLL